MMTEPFLVVIRRPALSYSDSGRMQTYVLRLTQVNALSVQSPHKVDMTNIHQFPQSQALLAPKSAHRRGCCRILAAMSPLAAKRAAQGCER